jgi:hypothetical protein
MDPQRGRLVGGFCIKIQCVGCIEESLRPLLALASGTTS